MAASPGQNNNNNQLVQVNCGGIRTRFIQKCGFRTLPVVWFRVKHKQANNTYFQRPRFHSNRSAHFIRVNKTTSPGLRVTTIAAIGKQMRRMSTVMEGNQIKALQDVLSPTNPLGSRAEPASLSAVMVHRARTIWSTRQFFHTRRGEYINRYNTPC